MPRRWVKATAEDADGGGAALPAAGRLCMTVEWGGWSAAKATGAANRATANALAARRLFISFPLKSVFVKSAIF